MKRKIALVLLLFVALNCLFAQTITTGREIPNLLSAVKAASAGDYILLPSGKRYVLTRQEIEIARGEFNYNNLSGARTEVRIDKTEIITISESHIVYRYPDGQSNHLMKTGPSFTAFLQFIRDNYYLSDYVDQAGGRNEKRKMEPPAFDVFRATAQFYNISNGIHTVQNVKIIAYNYRGENYEIRFNEEPFEWGYVNGTFWPVGETREIEFDIE